MNSTRNHGAADATRRLGTIRRSGAARSLGTLAAIAFALPFLACSDGATTGLGLDGPDGDGSDSDPVADEQPGTTSFYVGNPADASAAVVPGALASVSGAGGQPPIRGDQIFSLEIEVVRIEAHREAGGGWIGFDIDPPVTIDPATLNEGEVEVMTSEDVPEGDYDKVRIIPESITVQFQTSSSTTPIVVGRHEFDPAPTEHDVQIPGGNDKGILIPTGRFSVGENGDDLVIVWDADESAATIIATGSGKLLMRPVFVEADEEEEAALLGDDEEEQEEEE